MKMWNLLSAIKIEEKNIEDIRIYNTCSCTTAFKNIEITLDFNVKHIIGWGDNPSIEDRKKYQELSNEYTRLNRIFNEDKYRTECRTWRETYYKGISICEDIYEALNSWDIHIPILIDLCGHKGDYTSEQFFTYKSSVLCDMIERDCRELMKTVEFEKLTNTEIGRINKQIDFINWNFQRLEKQLNNQKKAYIISKIVDGKTERENYEKYPELINAVDAYIDIKKLINKKPYN
jgi:hypothetical protein